MLKHDRILYRNQTHNMLHTLLYFLALLSLSTSANWAKLNHMPSQVLGFWRLFIAALIMGLWFFVIKKSKWPAWKQQFGWVLLSGFLFFLHLWTFKYASKNTSISNTMIIFSSNPAWSSLGAVFLFNEKLHVRLIVSYVLALLGVFILVGNDLSLGSINYGDWSSLISAIFFALYMLASKKARQHYDNNFFSAVQYFVCAALFGLGVLATNTEFTGYDSVSWNAIIGLVLFPTLLGHLIFSYLVNFFDLSLLTCGKLIEPVFASIIAFYLFHEKVGLNTLIAFALTSLSLLILFYPALKRRLEGNR